MELIENFISTNMMYWSELWWTLAIGFLISGIFYKFIPTSIVEQHLGQKGLKPILIAASSHTHLA